MASRNLILAGFMCTGKSTVGAEVARRLGRPFVDVDAEIETRAGRSIAELFAGEGEPAFRRIEAAVCRELAARDGLVVATGGGALVDRANRETMAATGTIVRLTCAPEELRRRIASSAERPLLAGEETDAAIERLCSAREAAYAEIPWCIDTTLRSVDAAATDVLRFAGVTTIPVHHPTGTYPVHLGVGLLQGLGTALRATGPAHGTRVVIVAHLTVHRLYGQAVETTLVRAGFRVAVCLLPDGERYKNLTAAAHLYEAFLRHGLDRSGVVVALGGGVIGDVAGFAAATYLRGVRFVQVPTTLLAMIDASVGGKTGVDLPQGKNLVGAFKRPELVLVDPAVLDTLPEDELRCGVAETIKHGLLGDPALFVDLAGGRLGKESWCGEGGLARIERAVRVKLTIVEEDPFETGRRAILNLGHTVGHALEAVTGYALRHGEAVAIGLAAAARISTQLGVAPVSLVEQVESALRRWALPIRLPAVSIDAVVEAMGRDKKRSGASLRWVLPTRIGEAVVSEAVEEELVRATLEELGARRS